MLGTRGVRLGLLYPRLYEMQVRALFARRRAGPGQRRRGDGPAGRLRARARARTRADRARRARGGHDAACRVGTMIELPRACLQADRIAERADFFSFGTNDLTQTALGFSRDDIEAPPARPLHRHQDPRPLAVRDARHAGGRAADQDGRLARAPGAPAADARRLRRARRRPRLDRVPRTPPASTTSRARPTACRSRGSPPPSRRSGPGRRVGASRPARPRRARLRQRSTGLTTRWRGRRTLGDRLVVVTFRVGAELREAISSTLEDEAEVVYLSDLDHGGAGGRARLGPGAAVAEPGARARGTGGVRADRERGARAARVGRRRRRALRAPRARGAGGLQRGRLRAGRWPSTCSR